MRIKKYILSLTLLCCVSSLVKAQSTVVTFQPDGSVGLDANMRSIAATTNYGADVTIDASRDASNNRVRNAFQFDVSSIPTNAIISSAQLTLYGVAHSGTNPCFLRQNTAAWSETTLTWNTAVANTTVGQISLAQSSSATQNYVLDVKAFVQNMVNIPQTNYGFTLIKQDEATTGGLVFGSSDNTNAALRPKLVITYSLPMDIKCYATPATSGVSANGALNVTVQNGVPPYTYLWNDGSTTKELFSKLPGAYTLTVTDNVGNQVKKIAIIPAENTALAVTLNTDALSGKDAMVAIRDNGTLLYNNYKDNPLIEAIRGTASGWLKRRSLFEYDLSSIPSNAVINSANLLLYGSGHNPLNRPNDSYLTLNNSAWNEQTVTWNNHPGDDITISGIYMPGTSSASQNLNLNVKSHVEKWIQNPSSNFGWKLKLADEVTASYSILSYGSSDNATAALRPALSLNINIPVPTDVQRNWTMEETFDQNGQVIATTKVYADDLGRTTQSLSKNANGEVFATQTIYDAYGRAAIKSLPAYSGNSLTYNTQFMLNIMGQEYNYTNFDVAGKITNPDPVQVGLPNSVGTYYSDLNTLDTRQATATFPYTRTQFMQSPYGNAKTTNGADDAFNATTGREARQYSMVCGDELKYIFGSTNSYKVQTTTGNPLASTPLAISTANYIRATKSVVTSPDNKEVVSYSIGDKVIASCMSGLSSPDNCSMPTIQNYMDWYGTQSIDIHVPNANKGNITLPLPTYFTGEVTASVSSANISYTITDMRTETVLVNGTDYTINATTRTLDFGLPYLNANLGKPLFLRIKFSYAPAFVTSMQNSNLTLPKGIVQYALDYGRWTVNYYDVAGNLRKTVSAKGINCASPGTITMASTYDYSHLGQLIAKQTPDEGLTEYAYNDDGQARFAQNAIQKLNNKFSYSNYDKHGRVTETGEFSNTSGAGSNGLYFQNYYGNYVAPFVGNASSASIINNTDGLNDTYCNDAFFTSYEELSAANDVPSTYSYASNYLGKYKNGQVSKTWNSNTTTWYKYNPNGQQFASIKQINDAEYATYAGTGNNSIKTFENTYDPYFGYVTNNYYQKNVSTEYAEHQFSYNSLKQLSQVNFIAGLGSPATSLSQISYNKMGQVSRVVAGNYLQGVDYVYTLNGALKAINHPALSWQKDPGGDKTKLDLFGEILEYYPNDYKRTGSTIETNTNGLYNGKIYGQRYKTRNVVGTTNTGADYIDYLGTNQVQIITATNYDQQEIANRYTYDAFGQLATSTFGTFNNTTNVFAARTDYKEYGVTNGAIGYDANGNITRLQRNSYNVSGSTALLDNLTYNYNTTDNKHNQVTDAASNGFASSFNYKNQTAGSPATFMYDVRGQLTASPDEFISNITYYPSGQTKQITFTNGNTTTYYYDDQGQKYKTKYYNASAGSSKYTWFIFNAVYEYLTSAPSFNLKEITVGGQGRVGVYKQNGTGINISNGYVQYEIKDHLGNVRVTFKDNAGALQVLSKSDYYAFGGALPGRQWQDVGGDYRYGYQGQEKSQTDVNWDNFELRTYNHDLGRWSAPDPYGQHHSPYLAMGNNPVNNIDPDGGYMMMANSAEQAAYWNSERQMYGYWAQKKAHEEYLKTHTQEALYASYQEKFSQLILGGGLGNQDKFLKTLNELNNEYLGLGLAGAKMQSGIDYVGSGASPDLLKANLAQTNGFGGLEEATAMLGGYRAYADTWAKMTPSERNANYKQHGIENILTVGWGFDETVFLKKGDNYSVFNSYQQVVIKDAVTGKVKEASAPEYMGTFMTINGGSWIRLDGFSQKKDVKIVDNSLDAFAHYYSGDGSAVNLGPSTILSLLVSSDFVKRHTRIKEGKTTSLKGNFSVNLTSTVFHVGRTNVNYSINITKNNTCSVQYNLFVDDGFWDVDFIDENTGGWNSNKNSPDGLGPNLERFGGTPYPYLQTIITIDFPNPGYK